MIENYDMVYNFIAKKYEYPLIFLPIIHVKLTKSISLSEVYMVKLSGYTTKTLKPIKHVSIERLTITCKGK